MWRDTLEWLKHEMHMPIILSRSEWGKKYPPSIGLSHVEPPDHDVLRFYGNMTGCSENVLRKKWFRHFHPIVVVASGQDLKDELTPGGELTINVWRCIHHMLNAKKKKKYRGWFARLGGIFDLRFVEEPCKADKKVDWHYINMMMNSNLMGYKIDWLKKFMFPVLFMDCWSLYILDTEKKIVMVLDPTETQMR